MACIFTTVTLLGCGKNEDAPTYQELKGRVAAVDQANGIVEMNWFSPKQKKEIMLSGKLAPDAEILINGATARLEDIQVDDKVTVIGREERHDGKRDLVATKVEVIRSEPAESTASKPAK
jgi:outer membrane lipoprotein-sorting protein